MFKSIKAKEQLEYHLLLSQTIPLKENTQTPRNTAEEFIIRVGQEYEDNLEEIHS